MTLQRRFSEAGLAKIAARVNERCDEAAWALSPWDELSPEEQASLTTQVRAVVDVIAEIDADVPVTCEAGKTGEGTAPAVPRPGSVTNAAMRALIEFAKEERATGAVIAHNSFDGILAEHALALDRVRVVLGEALATHGDYRVSAIKSAIKTLDDEITYVRALGSVAATEEEEDAK